MKKLIFLFFPFLLFADTLFWYDGLNVPFVLDSSHYLGSCKPGDTYPGNALTYCISGGFYSYAGDASGYNMSCLKNNAHSIIFYGSDYHETASSAYNTVSNSAAHGYEYSGTFCKNKPGYVYNANDNIWYPTSPDSNNSTPICPDGKQWNADEEKCVNTPTCPDYDTMLKQVAPNCGGSSYVKNVECNSSTGKISYTCMQCSDIKDSLLNNCQSQGKLLTFNCTSSDTSLKFSYQCVVPPSDTNNSNSGSSDNNSSDVSNTQDGCLKSGGNWLCVSDDCQCIYSDNGSGSNNGSSSDSGSSLQCK